MVQTSTGDASIEQAVRRLLSSATLINQAVGDALSDLLFCEAVLRLKGWGCKVGHRRGGKHLEHLDFIGRVEFVYPNQIEISVVIFSLFFFVQGDFASDKCDPSGITITPNQG